MRSFGVALLFAACAGGPGGETPTAPGAVRLCLTSSAPITLVDDGGIRRVDVEGTVTATTRRSPPLPEALAPCTVGEGSFVQLQDADGTDWQLGWTATAGDLDMSPALALGVGQTVSVAFIQLGSFVQDTAVVMRDEDGVVLAAVEGFGQTLDEAAPDVLPELTVSRGDSLGTFYSSDCGRRVTDAVVFEDGVARQEAGIWVETTVTVNGRPLQARNVGAWHFVDQPTCLDVWGPAPWIVWRPFEQG